MSDYETVLTGLCQCGNESCNERMAAAKRMADEIDRLRAELARYEADAIHTCGPDCKRPMCVLRAELAAANEAVKALEDARYQLQRMGTQIVPAPSQDAKDSERYRWLRTNFARLCVNTSPTYDAGCDKLLTVVRAIDINENFRESEPTSVDAAIDAAMLASKGGAT